MQNRRQPAATCPSVFVEHKVRIPHQLGVNATVTVPRMSDMGSVEGTPSRNDMAFMSVIRPVK